MPPAGWSIGKFGDILWISDDVRGAQPTMGSVTPGPELYKKAKWASLETVFLHSLCFNSYLLLPALGSCPDFIS